MKNGTAILFWILTSLAFATAQSQLDSLPSSLNPDWEIDLDDVVVTAQYAPTDSKN